MTIGNRIREVRLKTKLTQKQLGDRSGIAEPTIRRYELGKLNPKIETLQKIADALGVDVNYLLHGYTLSDRDEAFINRLKGEGETSPAVIHETHEQQAQRDALNHAFDLLNKTGRDKAVERVQELAEVPKYRADSSKQAPPQPSPSTPDADHTDE